MKIATSRYTLQYSGSKERPPRQGALLKVSFPDHLCGFADCHPWAELGDDPLDQQLQKLAQNELTSLTERTLAFARIDAEARGEKRNLFKDLTIPRSHKLIAGTDMLNIQNAAAEGARLIKVKVGNDIHADATALDRCAGELHRLGMKLRLDFNCKIDEQAFLNFLKNGTAWIKYIDFFEDPFLYDPIRWEKVREEYGIQLACDRHAHLALEFPRSCDVLVVKPAVQDAAHFLTSRPDSRKLVFTSYLDHPLGQLGAAYVAAKAAASSDRVIECGLLSHQVYTPTPFSSRLKHHATLLMPPMEGSGWGFTDLLENIEWVDL